MKVEKDAVIDTIAKNIRNCIEKGKSLRQIELYSGVSRSYIHRLSMALIAYDKIDPVKLFQVLKIVKNLQFAYEVLGTNEAWEQRVKKFTGFSRIDAIEDREIEQAIISSEENIKVFLLACNHCGVKKDKLFRVGGITLIEAATDLIEKGILKEDDLGVITEASGRLKDNRFFSFSKIACKKINVVLTSMYNPNRKPPIPSDIYNSTEACSKEFADEVETKMDDFKKWLEKEKAKTKNKGKYPLFFTMTKDLFYDE